MENFIEEKLHTQQPRQIKREEEELKSETGKNKGSHAHENNEIRF